MTDQLPVFRPGDHFATRDVNEDTRLWRVDQRGLTKIVSRSDVDEIRELDDGYTVAQAARLLGKSERTIWARIQSGTLPSTKSGSSRRIPRFAVDKLLP